MDVRLPNLGEGADSGSVATVYVKVGDVIKKEQPIIELESEKAVASIPSPAAGKVTNIRVKEGDKVMVGQVILTLEGAGAVEEAPKKAPVTEKKRAIEKEVAPVAEANVEFAAPATGLAPAASPTIRKLARELGIDLTRVRGSERGGRIVMADLKAYIEGLQRVAFARVAAPPKAEAPAKPAVESIDFSKWGPVRKQKLTPIRQTIARRMVESRATIPEVTQFEEADITRLMELRKKHLDAYKQKGAHLTVTPFVLKALVAVLKKNPKFNSSLDEVTGEIVFKDYYHFGIAVDTEHGLMVPVLRDADKKSLLALSVEIDQLAENARQRKLTAEDFKGGTFTISNQGGIGGAHFTPIINKPEVAILGLGRGVLKAVVKDKKIEQRLMLPLCLAYDHRVVDGAEAARFITELAQLLEQFKEDDVKL
jgi:pyruvate dehydrogenase E2 component (dihydrolipoamide acetyltransferase)